MKIPAFATTPCMFTIHNLGYQGLFPPEILPLLMLPWDLFTMSKLEFYGKVNFLKGAISMADFITTVSRKYAQEIQTAEYGFGLEGVLRARGNTIAGILNAVDYASWNPETDPLHRRTLLRSGPQRQGEMQGRSAEGSSVWRRIRNCRWWASCRASYRKRAST